MELVLYSILTMYSTKHTLPKRRYGQNRSILQTKISFKVHGNSRAAKYKIKSTNKQNRNSLRSKHYLAYCYVIVNNVLLWLSG